ncbi:Rok-like winged helix domain-containing protein [Bacillus swezeyi]|uniref:Uncharacterized protein n=1 Tax=Bacillus swezeyi TaxID=1925020 RepID=A0A5M8RWM9_9BACI|nr:hypothetical protein [Bacillus swezeyi]KAA6453045.1 hypothetical protein DX927_02175 [Bacillus swezeyi]KAA6476335.1 hypothetical protein DX928_09750 [Bacillus swezeyi]TYS38417.1 hypothetical protein FZC77_02095 [Bacillus swezeyi]
MSNREALKKQLLLLGELEQKVWRDIRKEREGIYERLGELDRQIQRYRRSNKEYYAAHCVDIIKQQKGNIVTTKELKMKLKERTNFNVHRISELYELIQKLEPNISKERRGCFLYLGNDYDKNGSRL